MGEATGIAGMITATELINSYVLFKETERIRSSIDELLDKTDFAPYGAPDRLLELKTIDFRDKKLWMPFADKQRPISGAGHGMAGIAESLFAASKELSDEKYADATKCYFFENGWLEKVSEQLSDWKNLSV